MSRTAAWAVALVACLVLSAGCVDQDKEMATYKKVLHGDDTRPLRLDYADGTPLTLEEALLLANRREERLAIQGETYLQSLIARDRAYSAFEPTFSLAPTFSWQNKKSSGGSVFAGTTGTGTGIGTGVGTGGTGVGGTGTGSTGGSVTGVNSASIGRNRYTTYDVPLNARANLFNGFRDVANLRAAFAQVDQNRAALLDLQAQVLLETAQTYYDVLLAERQVEVLSNSVFFQRARVQDMQSRFRAGIAQPLDVAQTEAQEADTQAQLETARQNVFNARTTLAFLTNANVQNASLIDRLAIPEQLRPPADAVRTAGQARFDIRAAASAVEVARQNVQTALGEYYPSVTLNLDYYLRRQSFPTSVEWASILSANIPIFSAGVIEADVRDAWSRLRQALFTEWQLVRQVDHDVLQAWEAVEASRRRILDYRTEVAASQEALRQAVQRYQVAGLATNLDVLTAQNSLLNSQLLLATEEANRKIYYLDLLRATGQLPLPANINSMSGAPATRPSTQETAPLQSIPAPATPATQPSGPAR